MPSRYEEQYHRVQRWYARVSALHKGRDHSVESDNYVDEVYAFFMNCYHLKDWIQHDTLVPASVRDVVDDYVTSSRPLRLCADICNSLKHLTRDRKQRSGESPAFGKKKYRLALGGGLPKIGLTYEIDTASGTTDVYTLATECLAAWTNFLTQHGLVKTRGS